MQEEEQLRRRETAGEVERGAGVAGARLQSAGGPQEPFTTHRNEQSRERSRSVGDLGTSLALRLERIARARAKFCRPCSVCWSALESVHGRSQGEAFA